MYINKTDSNLFFKKGGDKELLVNTVIHLDETTPQMQVASVPITKDLDGKAHLSAKLIMGNKKDYKDG